MTATGPVQPTKIHDWTIAGVLAVLECVLEHRSTVAPLAAILTGETQTRETLLVMAREIGILLRPSSDYAAAPIGSTAIPVPHSPSLRIDYETACRLIGSGAAGDAWMCEALVAAVLHDRYWPARTRSVARYMLEVYAAAPRGGTDPTEATS